jgi:hypothetical protein
MLLFRLQLEWLENDLKQASQNRHRQPWIIAMGHRPFYCNAHKVFECGEYTVLLRNAAEDLFMKYGVDLVLTAHMHNYERTAQIYKNQTNPK